jgi:hypothetical protein
MKHMLKLVLVAGIAFALAAPAFADTSGCVLNPGSATMTCSLIENETTGVIGETTVTEIVRAESLFPPGDWVPGWVVLLDAGHTTSLPIEGWSDIVWFVPVSAGATVSVAVTMFSDLGAGFGWNQLLTDSSGLSFIPLQVYEDTNTRYIAEGWPGTFQRYSTGGYYLDTFKTYSDPVPEPATLTLFGSGLIGLAGLVRRRLKK